MDNKQRDFDEMFRDSQISKFPKEESQSSKFDEQFRQSYAKKNKDKTPENPEVLDSTGRPINQKNLKLRFEALGLISAIIGVIAFILVFVGMFIHVLLWINILLCIVGITLGAIAMFKKSAMRLFAGAGIILCLLTLVVNVICMIVVAIISGFAALTKLIF